MKRMPNNPRVNVAVGGVLGATAVVASLLALGSSVSAQASAPSSDTESVSSARADGIVVSGDESVDFEAIDKAWVAYDACLADNGIDIGTEINELEQLEELEDDSGSLFVQSGDDLSFAAFGDGDATVTITKEGDVINVEGSGDVQIEDSTFDLDGEWTEEDDAQWEAAYEACEGELPEDALFGDLMVEAVHGELTESVTIEESAGS